MERARNRRIEIYNEVIPEEGFKFLMNRIER